MTSPRLTSPHQVSTMHCVLTPLHALLFLQAPTDPIHSLATFLPFLPSVHTVLLNWVTIFLVTTIVQPACNTSMWLHNSDTEGQGLDFKLCSPPRLLSLPLSPFLPFPSSPLPPFPYFPSLPSFTSLTHSSFPFLPPSTPLPLTIQPHSASLQDHAHWTTPETRPPQS